MHLIYENVIKNLVLLWTGNYKGLDEGTGEYELNPTVWEAIGAATSAGGSTIPTAFGARPPDISKDRTACTADTWSFWLLYIGPILLHNKFKRHIYYDHFISFVKLIHICLQFEYTKDDIATIRSGFTQWVRDFERLYYQYSPDRLSACPLTLHALLHIADGIEAAGPVWAYWAFPMECFCGRLQPCIKSRRFPFASIDGHVVATAQLSVVKVKYTVDLRLGPPKLDIANGTFSHPSYPTCVLLPPRRISVPVSNPLDAGLARKIAIALSTRFNKPMATIRKHFKADKVEQWAKVQRLDDGDRMLASSMMMAELDDRRDTTYVQVPPRYEPVTFYGQLQNIFIVKLGPTPDLELDSETTLILAAVRTCEIILRNDLDMHYYKKDGPVEGVDMSSIQCLVGWIKTTDRKNWVVIDRSGSLSCPYYDPED
ncbi:hypothetical protein DFH07DRAFT_869619 [Mycena maculata]|uniref:DUF4218 domain-containing protein n=1 Tax=Mycena maculata TaxID=230809 RepID=A0AAD7IN25_9AGAR|nr:hypothetical protein DFH07DRAFT_872310 [Mycena maculata]KAJ7746511.1 hypothetical protein DFH07DRAFT_869619 [Mycena maculata]